MKCETCGRELKDSLEKVSNCTMEIGTPVLGLDTGDSLLYITIEEIYRIFEEGVTRINVKHIEQDTQQLEVY